MLIQWIGVALILTCKGLLVGNRGQLSSPRSVAGVAAGIVGSALFLGGIVLRRSPTAVLVRGDRVGCRVCVRSRRSEK